MSCTESLPPNSPEPEKQAFISSNPQAKSICLPARYPKKRQTTLEALVTWPITRSHSFCLDKTPVQLEKLASTKKRNPTALCVR
ncbi:hypothetical protein CEXT_273861 [Caerostris extrusa]|uniref:Uncharacterized protein n=1 Tax=Caerostris extrusa TaxID=172846 RepID=A0AAV4NPN7_CAEEX|nr:hypothetical protein CEXT_273861 [Caerostris extrusa]